MFWKYAIFRNRHLWFHMLGGGLIAKVLPFIETTTFGSYMAVVGILAIVWEIVEFTYIQVLKKKLDVIYGNVEIGAIRHFLFDGLGDFLGALVMAAIVLL